MATLRWKKKVSGSSFLKVSYPQRSLKVISYTSFTLKAAIEEDFMIVCVYIESGWNARAAAGFQQNNIK